MGVVWLQELGTACKLRGRESSSPGFAELPGVLIGLCNSATFGGSSGKGVAAGLQELGIGCCMRMRGRAARVRVALDPGEFGLPAPAPEYGVRAQHCAAHMIT